MTVHKVLKRAKALIKSARNWTTGTFARNEDGQAVSVKDVAACQFCAIGAVRYICLDKSYLAYKVEDFLEYISHDMVANINDRQGHAAVMDLFDKAIELSKDK